jgi:glycosyltransferase involved in cell wall biosynthesis
MKIGLFLGNMSPTEGGGYTLLMDQLSALSRLRRSSGHDIVLLHHAAGSSFAAQFSEFSTINLDAERRGVRTQQELEALLHEQRVLETEQRTHEEQRQARDAEKRERAEALIRQKDDEFERRRAKMARVSDFASRVYSALYGSYSRSASLSALGTSIFQTSEPVSQPIVPAQASEPSAPSWSASICHREGIQFIIYLAPWFGEIDMDIPFALMVWDLQHRISPWFPEVSAGDEWNRREKNYAELLRRATLIFTGTRQGRDDITAYYQVPSDRIKVLPFLPPGFVLDAARTPRDTDRLSKFELPARYLFYPAQFWPHKNHVLVLEACKIVRDETGWDIGVVFTGSDKGNLNYVREYSDRLGLEKCVKFLGFVEKEDILELYRGAVCLVFPTFFGPDNLPPLEAFALGCPVIASDIPGAREQLGDAAILVSPTNERALVEAILGLRNDEMRAQIVSAGLAVAAKADWDEYGLRLLDSVTEFASVRRLWS